MPNRPTFDHGLHECAARVLLAISAPLLAVLLTSLAAEAPARIEIVAGGESAYAIAVPEERKGKMRGVAGLLPGRTPLGTMKKSYLEAGGRVPAAPLTWDFALLRGKGVLPGTGSRSAKCPRIRRIILDGKLDDPDWRSASFEELDEIGMGALKNASRFKTAYDDRYLYLGMICELDDLRRIEEVEPVGEDGRAYRYECLEIMLDAFGTREKYCHFILNPVPDSTYDRRFGYIDDPLDPLYKKPDKGWKGDWDYATTVDRKRLRWSAEVRVPFATLEAEPPAAGTVWTLNIGRAEWPQGPSVRPAVYSLWSPNLETRSFHDPATFGALLFE